MMPLLLQNKKLLAVVSLVALLPVLATLQYRWIGQISTSEVDRMRENLETSARHFGQAINNELFPAQFSFRVSFTRSMPDIARELRLNYQFWASHASHPDLIEAIYWIDYDAHKTLRLHLFDPKDGTLAELPWPEDLEGWRTYFLERNRLQIEQYNPRIAATANSPDRASEFVRLSAALMTERPAIPIPVSIDSELAPEDLLANLNATSSGQAGHTLITLDQKYLTKTFFPALQTEFFDAKEDDIDLRIISHSDPDQVIYQSDPALTSLDFEEPDIEREIARLRWMSFASTANIAFGYASLMDRDQSIADSILNRTQRGLKPASRDSFVVESPYDTDFPLQAIIRLARAEEYEGELTSEDLLVALTSLQEQSRSSQHAGAPPIPAIPSNAWNLLLRHKTGSLEAAVRANRLRNLLLSFGILSILGVAIVMIYSSARRSQRLAQRQIDFVTGVSHELRTPLAVIRSAADNLADGVVADNEKMKKYGQLISREGKRLSEMVEQILELAGVQSGKKIFDFQQVGMESLIEEALAAWKDTINEKGFDVSKSIQEDLPAIQGDEKSLQIVLNNLINNAIKYSNGSHWLGIDASLVHHGKKPEVVVSISDRGVGIPADELPHIFDEFYRGRDAQQTQIRGNGIGLSIVKKTMEAHGGGVSVTSKPHEGSTFTLHFPLSHTV